MNGRVYGVKENTKIGSFFKERLLEWDEVKLREVFDDEDVAGIMRTKIPQYEVSDRVAWLHTKSGNFYVKSGYQLWLNNNVQSQSDATSDGSRRLWNLRFPPKVKYFLWIFCKNNVRIRVVLHSRNYAIPILCPMCNRDMEHLLHVFFDCYFAAQCWQQVGIQYDMWVVENASAWLLDKLGTESYEKLCTIAMTLWGI